MFLRLILVGDEPFNLSCVSINFYTLSCIKSFGTRDEWKNLTPELTSDLAVCELTLQLWQ